MEATLFNCTAWPQGYAHSRRPPCCANTARQDTALGDTRAPWLLQGGLQALVLSSTAWKVWGNEPGGPCQISDAVNGVGHLLKLSENLFFFFFKLFNLSPITKTRRKMELFGGSKDSEEELVRMERLNTEKHCTLSLFNLERPWSKTTFPVSSPLSTVSQASRANDTHLAGDYRHCFPIL